MQCPFCDNSLSADEVRNQFCFRCNKRLGSATPNHPFPASGDTDVSSPPSLSVNEPDNSLYNWALLAERLAPKTRTNVAFRDIDFEISHGDLLFFPSSNSVLQQMFLYGFGFLLSIIIGFNIYGDSLEAIGKPAAIAAGILVAAIAFGLIFFIVNGLMALVAGQRWFRFSKRDAKIEANVWGDRSSWALDKVVAVKVVPHLAISDPGAPSPSRMVEVYLLVVVVDPQEFVVISDHVDGEWTHKAANAISKYVAVSESKKP